MDDQNQKRFTDKLLNRPGGLSGRKQLLDQLRYVREHDTSKQSWDEHGFLLFSIPEVDYAILERRYPDINAPDAATREAAWAKLRKDPLMERYKPHRDVLHKNNHKVIVK